MPHPSQKVKFFTYSAILLRFETQHFHMFKLCKITTPCLSNAASFMADNFKKSCYSKNCQALDFIHWPYERLSSLGIMRPAVEDHFQTHLHTIAVISEGFKGNSYSCRHDANYGENNKSFMKTTTSLRSLSFIFKYKQSYQFCSC